MSVQFQCPSCAAVRSIDDRLLGHRVRCPDCDELVDIPLTIADERVADTAPAEKQTSPGSTKRGKTPSTPPSVKRPKTERPPDDIEVPDPATDDEVLDEPIGFGGSGHDESEMDMTPMVDVTFLLLIFFMVTAAFSMQKALNVPKPKEDQASTTAVEEEQDEDAVTIEVDEFDSFLVITSNDEFEALSRHELLRLLQEARQASGAGLQPPNKLIVKAHEDCTHERVVMALDAGAETGFQQVQLMTVTEN